MAAKIELDIFLKGDIALNQLFSPIEAEGFHIDIDEMIIFDDWEFTNQMNINPSFVQEHPEHFLFQKFTAIYFTIDAHWDCVLLTSSINNTYLEISFALDSKKILEFAKGRNEDIENVTERLYARTIDVLIDKAQNIKDIFLGASMGVECTINFEGDIIAAVSDSDYATHWVLPRHIGEQLTLPDFTREERNDFIVFTFQGGIWNRR